MIFFGKNLQKRFKIYKENITITKLQLKLTDFNFWTKLTQEGYFQSTKNKMNTTIGFCIFELV